MKTPNLSLLANGVIIRIFPAGNDSTWVTYSLIQLSDNN